MESNQSFKVENNIETFKSTLENMRDIINELDDIIMYFNMRF